MIAVSLTDLILAGVAAIAAGLVNAIAGGGTLITFPVLTALGIPAVAANVTNTVALCPGYLGGSFSQRNDLKGQKHRIYWLVPLAITGGIAGGLLLLLSGEHIFRNLVPWLILFASLL
ncbi:MAG: sulfite exporter TauE/SafE family protein, partial [Bacteroidetes bacterium]|nr:sulfite exporter TauE/SafE family protein [Bacteroidota bacterium]